MNQLRRVAVLIDTDDSWGRDVVAAIAVAARRHRWNLLIAPRDHQHRLRLPRQWQGDGILVSMRDQPMAAHVRRTGLPAVDVSSMMNRATWLGRVMTDDRQRAEMAFRHFRERHFQHFACYAPAIGRYSLNRIRKFASLATESGFSCAVFAQRGQTRGWDVDQKHVLQWMSQLARPLAVFAADAYPARQMAEICVWNDLAVPEDIAILSGDNDDLLCSVLSPHLSSVQLDCRRIGTEAAGMLQRMMNGGRVPVHPKQIAPLYVNARQPTDRMAVDDPDVAAILRYMARHAASGLTVADVVRRFPISRRALEQRFKLVLGRSPGKQLRSLRMTAVQKLLRDTDYSITEIAHRTGFASSSALSRQFTQHFGTSPSAARAAVTQT